jgi:type VI secretion system protein ImpK
MPTTTEYSPVNEASRRPENLALLFQEMLTVVVRLRAGRQRLTDLEVFRMQIRNALKGVEQDGLACGYQVEDLRVATFAVVAFLDESILDSQNPFFDDWPFQPLQLELFGVQAGGEIFYRNLDRLLARPDSATLADLLEVHQICLLLGFRGRYGLYRTPLEIDAISQRLETSINRIRGAGSIALWRRAALPLAAALKPPVPRYLRASSYLEADWSAVARTLLHRKKTEENLETLTEIDLHFSKAAQCLHDSHGIRKLEEVPTVFLLGDPGAGKSTLIAKAGIQAELLSGQGALAPTQTLNLWHAWNTLFVDPSGALLAAPALRARLFRKFVPHTTRCVILTVNCEVFFLPGGVETLAIKARYFQLLLSELSREIGSGFPVFVVFTKADQIPYFQDFTANLNQAEAAETFGAALTGNETVSTAFQNLYRFLADERKILLAREPVDAHLADIYEFPREFVKLRPLLVQFLAHLGQPLGFYFTGVRPAGNSASTCSKQWVFVKRLFSEVILAGHRPIPLTTPGVMASANG